MESVQASRAAAGLHALDQLAELSGDQVLGQSYVPVNVAALSEAGLASEVNAQVTRGDELLREARLKPTGSPWLDVASSFSQGDAAGLDTGLQAAGTGHLVLSDTDLASGNTGNLTDAQPFTLDLGHGATVEAMAADSTLGARFTAQPGDPVLGAQQLLASLAFVHFENASVLQPRGEVVAPPAGWQPSATFLDTLLGGLSGNPALSPVTLDQLLAQVPVGGNGEPKVRHLQAGAAGRGITRGAAQRIASGPPAAGLVRHRGQQQPLGDRGRRCRLRQAPQHRGAQLQHARARRRAERLHQGLRRRDRADHPGHGADGDLHRKAGSHPGHHPFSRHVSRHGRPHLDE